MSLPNRLLLAAFSGLSVWPLSELLGDASKWFSYIAVGAVFGALVLVPLLSQKRKRAGAILALIIGSILIYMLAVELVAHGYGPLKLRGKSSIVLSGLIGALLVCALAAWTVPLKSSSRLWTIGAAAGFVGGFIFSWTVDSTHGAVVAAGYAAWQMLVCFALWFGSAARRDEPAAV